MDSPSTDKPNCTKKYYALDPKKKRLIVFSVVASVLIGSIVAIVLVTKGDPIEAPSATSPNTTSPNETSPTISIGPPRTSLPTYFSTPTPSIPTEEYFSPSSPLSPQPTVNVTYRPGLLTGWEEELHLSQGLRARIIARTNLTVPYHNGTNSSIPFHGRPDFGATFWDPSPKNKGGWIYMSNSEMLEEGEGGVGAIKFNKHGHLLEYRMLLTNTTKNCGGGHTPWNTFISCEEVMSTGQCYQVDPTGKRKAEKLTMGLDGDQFESWTFDHRNESQPYYFATADRPLGALRRWTPLRVNHSDPWSTLHGNGTLTFLQLYPYHNLTNSSSGTFNWTTNHHHGMHNAIAHFPDSEGIDCVDGVLYFVSKTRKILYILDLDRGVFTRQSTVRGLFEGSADQIKRILADDASNEILYFTEEYNGGGIHARNRNGEYFTILEGYKHTYPSESTGLAFSPDGRHLYFAYQRMGVLFDVWRQDGLAFHGPSLDVHFHQVNFAGSSGGL